MKKLKTILTILILLFCSYNVPTVNAKDKVNVYLFYGDGCPHCEAFIEYMDGLSDEEKSRFELVKYEVWYDEDNGTLMNDVAKAIGDSDVTGVPYIVIGKKSFSGYSEASNNDIQSAIDEAAKEDYDVMDNIDKKGNSKKDDKESSNNNLIVYISLAIIVVGVVGLLIYTKKSVE